MIELTPTHYELHDEANDLLAKIEMFDAHASEVEIKTVVCPASWPALSEAILQALRHMHPEKKA